MIIAALRFVGAELVGDDDEQYSPASDPADRQAPAEDRADASDDAGMGGADYAMEWKGSKWLNPPAPRAADLAATAPPAAPAQQQSAAGLTA